MGGSVSVGRISTVGVDMGTCAGVVVAAGIPGVGISGVFIDFSIGVVVGLAVVQDAKENKNIIDKSSRFPKGSIFSPLTQNLRANLRKDKDGRIHYFVPVFTMINSIHPGSIPGRSG